MRFNLLLFLLLSTFFACKSDQSKTEVNKYDIPFDKPTTEEKTLYNEIMVIHDEVMPLMGEIERLKSTLNEKRDAIPFEEESERREKIVSLLSGLNKSESTMWDWMNNFGKIHELERDQILRFLVENRMSVENMANLMDESLDSVKVFVHIKD